MNPTPEQDDSAAAFPPTQWDLVRSPRHARALNQLVSLYWEPLYCFVRRHGHDPETAQDVVQEFWATLIERRALSKADPERGRFRTFLLASLTNFLKDRAKAQSRRKRGGGATIVSLDVAEGERTYSSLASVQETPEETFHRAWVRGLLHRAFGRLRGEASHLAAFRLLLSGADYRSIAGKTGLSVAAAKTAVHRLRDQLREILADLLHPSPESPEDLEREILSF